MAIVARHFRQGLRAGDRDPLLLAAGELARVALRLLGHAHPLELGRRPLSRLLLAEPEHADIAPDLFTAETPLGTYQGITEKVLTRTPASFRTVLVPRGSSKPEWLAD